MSSTELLLTTKLTTAELTLLKTAYVLQGEPQPYRVGKAGINNLVVGLQWDGQHYVLKRHTSQSDLATLRYEHALLQWLGRQGLPFAVPTPVATQMGETLLPTGVDYLALYPVIAGVAPNPQHPEQMEEFGRSLAKLHQALAVHPQHNRPQMHGYSELGQVHPNAPDGATVTPEQVGLMPSGEWDDLFAWWRTEFAAMQLFIEKHYRYLPRQVIHGDYVPSNSLFAGDKLTGLLDFEFAMPDARALDVAMGLEFTLRSWENPDPWAVGTAFCRGYGSIQKLAAAECAAFLRLMDLRDMVSILWWLGRSQGAVVKELWRLHDFRTARAWRITHAGEFANLINSTLAA